MGKIVFPLINVRKDVTSSWQMHHYSGEDVEIIEVPQYSNEYGFYTAWLKEVPDSGSGNLNTTPVKITGLTEFRGVPVDPNTKRLKLTPVQYFVNYQTGEILFHPSQAGATLKVDYWGKGSLIESDDINYLYDMIQRLEKEHDVPEFTKFEIEGFTNNLEVGFIFPKDSTPSIVKFKYELSFPERIQPNSIKIENLLNNTVIADKVESTIECEVEFHEVFRFFNPTELIFRISAVASNGDPISRDLVLTWTDKIYWDVVPVSQNEPVTSDQILGFNNSKHLDYVSNDYHIKIDFEEKEDHYKVIALPERLPINQLVDIETSLRFIFQDPIRVEVNNSQGLNIPYLVYFSAFPIIKKLTLIGKIGGGE